MDLIKLIEDIIFIDVSEGLNLLLTIKHNLLSNLIGNTDLVLLIWLQLQILDQKSCKFFGLIVGVADVPLDLVGEILVSQVYCDNMLAISHTISVSKYTVFDHGLHWKVIQTIGKLNFSIYYIGNEIGKGWNVVALIFSNGFLAKIVAEEVDGE